MWKWLTTTGKSILTSWRPILAALLIGLTWGYVWGLERGDEKADARVTKIRSEWQAVEIKRLSLNVTIQRRSIEGAMRGNERGRRDAAISLAVSTVMMDTYRKAIADIRKVPDARRHRLDPELVRVWAEIAAAANRSLAKLYPGERSSGGGQDPSESSGAS